MFIIKRFKYLPHVLIGVLGLAIAGTSFYFLNNRYTEPIPMKDIVVTAREVPMYETITGQDLKTIQVPATTNTDNYLIEFTEIVGKVSKAPISSNELIMPDSLLDKEEVENIAFITINTLYAKTGGAKPGDIVNVYKVMAEKGDWVEGDQAYLVSEDVVVVSVTTANGKSVGEGNKMPLGGSEKIEVVKLGVKLEDVKYLAPAAAVVDNRYVLVVKSSYHETDDLERDPNLDNVLKENEESNENEEGGEKENDEVISEEENRDGETSENDGNS